MDMEEIVASDFHDQQAIPDSNDSRGGVNNSSSCLEGIEGYSEGIIRPDYFSLDSQAKYAGVAIQGDVTDDNSVESDNPSWIDPVSETQYSKVAKEIGGFWSSSSDLSDDGKSTELEAKNEQGIAEGAKIQVGYEISAVAAAELDENLVVVDDKAHEELETSGEVKVVDVQKEGGDQEENEVKKLGGADRNRGLSVWWKLPLDLLRFCLFKASPVWTLSVAAAMMGVLILGRRLYKMKRKSRSLGVNMKESRVMSRAARLNEAFSAVKRVPMIRPPLPAAVVAPWPVMS